MLFVGLVVPQNDLPWCSFVGLVLRDSFKMTCPGGDKQSAEQILSCTRTSSAHGRVTSVIGYYLGTTSPWFMFPLDMESMTVTSRLPNGMEMSAQVSVEVTDSKLTKKKYYIRIRILFVGSQEFVLYIMVMKQNKMI